MSATRNPLFTVPLQATHIDAALEAARTDREFRQEEMVWLEDNFNFFRLQVIDAYTNRIQRGEVDPSGINIAEFVMDGSLIGNRAVRLCTGDDDYDAVRQNFRKNNRWLIKKSDFVRFAIGHLDPLLAEVFDDEEIVQSLLNIRQENACRSAALAITYLCFSEVPITGAVTEEKPAAAST